MKKILFLAAMLAAIAVWAGGQVQSVTLNPTATITAFGPATSTAGIPAVVNGSNVYSATVTIQSIWDGGNPDEFAFGNLIAFKYDPSQPTGSDGGVGYTWARYPQLDMTVDGGTGVGQYNIATSAIAATIAVPALPSNNRLFWMYNTIAGNGADGGQALNAVVNTVGRY
jgi:hypothetical protein